MTRYSESGNSEKPNNPAETTMKSLFLRLLAAWRVLTRKNTAVFAFTRNFGEVEVISTGSATLDNWAEAVGETIKITE